jgi:hypothetical protein
MPDKKLEDVTVEGATELGKRVVAIGKSKAYVVIAYQHGDAPEIAIRSYKKVTGGWALQGYQTEPAEVARALATAIRELVR